MGDTLGRGLIVHQQRYPSSESNGVCMIICEDAHSNVYNTCMKASFHEEREAWDHKTIKLYKLRRHKVTKCVVIYMFARCMDFSSSYDFSI